MSLHPLSVGTKIYAVTDHNKIISFVVSEVEDLFPNNEIKTYKYYTTCLSKGEYEQYEWGCWHQKFYGNSDGKDISIPRRKQFLTSIGAKKVAIKNAVGKIGNAQNNLRSAEKELKELIN